MSSTDASLAPLLQQILKTPAALGPRAALCARLEALGVPAAGGAWAATTRMAAERGQFAVALALALRKLTGPARRDALDALAARYSADRPAGGPRLPPPMPPARAESVPADEDAQIGLAIRLLTDLAGLTLPAGSPLPVVPLFSALPAAHFVAVAQAMVEVTFKAGEALIRQGDDDRTLYLLAQGQARVEARQADGTITELAVALAPSLLGEISLLTAVPRRASVVALEPVLAWRLDAASLDRLQREAPDLHGHLERVVKQRLLQNVLRTSRLFATTGVPDVLVPAFQLQPVAAGAEVFAQGAASPGLYVVLHGAAEVWTRTPGAEPIRVATLTEGDAFGEFSLLTGQPTTAAVRMPEGGVLLHLSAKNFARLRPHLGTLETGLTEMMEVRRGELDDLVDPVDDGGFERVEEAWLLAE
jgi:CRP-like cAMP-binding protein